MWKKARAVVVVVVDLFAGVEEEVLFTPKEAKNKTRNISSASAKSCISV